jgi:hypothetical protein
MRWTFPFFGKSGDAEARLSDDGALLVQQYSGRWYQAAKQGRVFTGNAAAAGVVLPIYTATAQVFGLWNPAGSNVNGIIANVSATYVDTTGAAGGYCIAVNKNIGGQLATGGISAFTEGTPERGLVGQTMGAGGNRIRFTPSAATTIAPTLLRQLGFNQLVLTAAEDEQVLFQFYREFDGDLVIGPGTAVWLCGNIATASKWAPSITWVEEPA